MDASLRLATKRARAALALAAPICIACACASFGPGEKKLAASDPVRPEWPDVPPPPKGDTEFFVGRTVAKNVLQEKQAIHSGVNDALYHAAKSVGADVKGAVTVVDRSTGDVITGSEITDQDSEEVVRIDVSQHVPGMRHLDTYWEIWAVREGAGWFTRYKYWVLISVPKSDLDRLKEEIKKKAQSR